MPATQQNSVELKYSNMKTWQALDAIINSSNGLTSKEIVETARKGGLRVSEDTIRSTLSRGYKKRGIKAIKRNKKTKYYPKENDRPDKIRLASQQSIRGGYPWTAQTNQVLNDAKTPLSIEEIAKESQIRKNRCP